MNALELANYLDHTSDLGEFKHYESAAMLRRQHEAIVKLRGALENLERVSGTGMPSDDPARVAARAAIAKAEGGAG